MIEEPRKDAEYILTPNCHSGPRNEEEQKLLRDPAEIQKTLLDQFQWDDATEGTQEHPSFDFCNNLLDELPKMLLELIANLSSCHYEMYYMRYPVDLTRYPTINDVVNGDWNDDSKIILTALISAAIAGLSTEESVQTALQKRVNEVINVSEKHRLCYKVKSLRLCDDPIVVTVTDTVCERSSIEQERTYIEIILENAANSKPKEEPKIQVQESELGRISSENAV